MNVQKCDSKQQCKRTSLVVVYSCLCSAHNMMYISRWVFVHSKSLKCKRDYYLIIIANQCYNGETCGTLGLHSEDQNKNVPRSQLFAGKGFTELNTFSLYLLSYFYKPGKGISLRIIILFVYSQERTLKGKIKLPFIPFATPILTVNFCKMARSKQNE
jgi:hypothetical protein